MRASHRKIHKLINEEKSKITDKEFFLSKAFTGYLEDIAEVVSKRYNRPIKVNMSYDEKNDNFLANTNNREININAGNELISTIANRELKVNGIIGLLGHELGHVNFTNFYLSNVFISKLENGIFYPNQPVPKNKAEEIALEEIKTIFAAKDEIGCAVIENIVRNISNILEDAYVEARMCKEFPGKIKNCIITQRARFFNSMPSIKEQITQRLSKISVMLNLIVAYATVGEINNSGNYKGELIDKLNECILHIDNAIFDDDIKTRFKSSFQLMLKLWDYIKEIIEKEKKKSYSSTKSGKELKEKAKQNCDKTIKKGMPKISSEPKGKEFNSVKNKAAKEEKKELKNTRNEIKQAIEEEVERLKLQETDCIEAGDGIGIIKQDNNYAGSGYENTSKDIQRILNKVAEEKICKEEEDKLKNELQYNADCINFGFIHKNVDITIHRINPIPETLVTAYKETAPKLLVLSKQLQKGIKNVIIQRKYGGKMNGLFMGKRIEAKSLVRDDGRYFYKRNLPNDEMDLAISLLIDESGSMSGRDRITVARATSIVIYDFCRSLGIPISIMGHTADNREVELFSYADFNSVDGNDCYRIMDMSSRYSNRDGAAVRYVAERLLQRDEKVKLLIVISDGQPADVGYYGTAAEEDLRQIKKEYTKKGITLFAAAIGSDKEQIERIYKDGFLDITDLNLMPVNLIKLITKYIK